MAGPTEGAQILYGFKTTGECVRWNYYFDVWYEMAVHVIPRDIRMIRSYPESYEMHELYPCQYVFGYRIPDTAFHITKFIRIQDDPLRVSRIYNRLGQTEPIIKIGDEEFDG